MDKIYEPYHTDAKSFIEDVLNNNRPALVIFYHDSWAEDIEPHLPILAKYKEKVPTLPLYFYNTSIEKNQQLAEALGVEVSPTFMIFKNHNMNRWLEASKKVKVNNASILKFLGSPALYGADKDEAKTIMDSLNSKVKREKVSELKALKKLEAQQKEAMKAGVPLVESDKVKAKTPAKKAVKTVSVKAVEPAPKAKKRKM